VLYHTTVEQTGQEFVIPCFVLKPSKPVWQGMVNDCAMVLGTNAMVEYGLRTVHSNGVVVKSTGNINEYIVQRMLLSEKAHLAPGMSWWVKVKVEQSNESSPGNWALSPQRRIS